MMESKFSVTWDSHQKNICNGLSSLQQRGEFVDMTLAADGHHVKVHQMVLSLVSPYIKELITSAQCPHPVIFLNKISYTTLCAILEYVYTGEVLVDKEHLSELFEASQALQIRGLDEMHEIQSQENAATVLTSSYEIHPINKEDESDPSSTCKEKEEIIEKMTENGSDYMDETYEEKEIKSDDDHDEPDDQSQLQKFKYPRNETIFNNTMLQYTVSTQGSPQVVLNRYIYYLRYTRKGTSRRQWRCVDYIRRRCPAYLTTKNERVLGRGCAHNHPFHDIKIMKKIRDGNIYSALQAMENDEKYKNKLTTVKSVDNELCEAEENKMIKKI